VQRHAFEVDGLRYAGFACWSRGRESLIIYSFYLPPVPIAILPGMDLGYQLHKSNFSFRAASFRFFLVT
jgi:hypothetical protein